MNKRMTALAGITGIGLGILAGAVAAPASAGSNLSICTNYWGTQRPLVQANWTPAKAGAPEMKTLTGKITTPAPGYYVCAKASPDPMVYKSHIILGQKDYGVKFDRRSRDGATLPRTCLYVRTGSRPDCTKKGNGVKLAWTKMYERKTLEVPISQGGFEGWTFRLAWNRPEPRENFDVYICNTKVLGDNDWPCTNALEE